MSKDTYIHNPLEPFYLGRPDDTPEPFSLWEHYASYQHYRVIGYSNVGSIRPDYKPTIIYMNVASGARYTRPADDWMRSMHRVHEQEHDGWVLTFTPYPGIRLPVIISYSSIKDLAMASDHYRGAENLKGLTLWRTFRATETVPTARVTRLDLSFELASAWLQLQGIENGDTPLPETDPA